MSTERLTTTVSILDKDYRITCPQEEEASLLESARLLDTKMREIRGTGKVIGVERIAVMAALNIAHEMLHRGQTNQMQNSEVQVQIATMMKMLDGAIPKKPEPFSETSK
ncbi:cell division protein ZapA [Sansalvadorimonas verongulae]|uniref:cell division protein ZapA n=1 Tax=Sansalvadorimonas verongulae TaxID=2172824 RepID=UPI0012BC3DE1|nr:cell division protein ZapA [Sansalvadorimonas verongulae]MTI13306.1 cell division protein ZapA [Sansalvadorimonas verongulae]